MLAVLKRCNGEAQENNTEMCSAELSVLVFKTERHIINVWLPQYDIINNAIY